MRRPLAAIGAAVLAACGQPQGTGHASASPSGSTAAVGAASNPVEQRCATSHLVLSFGKSNAATGNYLQTVDLINRSASTCYLYGYPGVAQLDPARKEVGNAQRSTKSFFGDYPPPVRVDIPPAGQTTFDLTFGRADAGNCPGGAQPVTVAALKITPPGDYDSQVLRYQQPGPDCPSGLVVHPVGSLPKSG